MSEPASAQRLETLRALAKTAPKHSGVYLMLDKARAVLYVGKAKNLRHRVASYFRHTPHERAFTQLLVHNIHAIEYIITNNESEALLLENNLIKKERPKYNIRLRDDKDYICLRLSIKHPFPRLTIVRRPKPDGAKYFGPYISSWQIRKLTRYLLRLFPLRSCSDAVIKNRTRPCILYDINLCTAPCVGKIDHDNYGKLVREIELFLAGKTAPLTQTLKREMKQSAAAMDYPRAALLRDRITAIEASRTDQHVVFHDQRDLDVIGVSQLDSKLSLAILTLREGKTIGKREVVCDELHSMSPAEATETILSQHYLEELSFIPPRILLPIDLPNEKLLAQTFSKKSERKVTLVHPIRGELRALVEMANQNAELKLSKETHQSLRSQQLLQELQAALSLTNLPRRIEAYDISNIQGTDAVGSQVTFIDGKPSKANYRRYRIKTVVGANDFGMLAEVLSRRLQSSKDKTFADLMLIDGGRGQLHAASKVLQALGLEQLAIAAIAKPPHDHLNKGIDSDRIFTPGRKNPHPLKPGTPALKLLQQLRDEAHRFAKAYHHVRRKRSLLDNR